MDSPPIKSLISSETSEDERKLKCETEKLVRWHELLHNFTPAWSHRALKDPVKIAWAQEGEDLFVQLCEAIVQLIEDPSETNVVDWFVYRVSLHPIIGLCTAKRFAEIIRGDHEEDRKVRDLIQGLPDVLPNRLIFDRLMAWTKQVPAPDFEGHVNDVRGPDHVTGLRLHMYYSRISESRHIRYERLFGCKIEDAPALEIYEKVSVAEGLSLKSRDRQHLARNLRDAMAVEAIRAATPKTRGKPQDNSWPLNSTGDT